MTYTTVELIVGWGLNNDGTGGWAEDSPATIRNFFIKNGDTKTADLTSPDRHNNHLSSGFSANFEQASPGYNEFLFTMGSCDLGYMTAKRTEIEKFRSENGEFQLIYDSTYISPTGASLKVGPLSADPANPLITPVDNDHGDAANLALYAENAQIDNQNLNVITMGRNVYVRRRSVDLTKWTEWSACDASCSGGSKTRTREV